MRATRSSLTLMVLIVLLLIGCVTSTSASTLQSFTMLGVSMMPTLHDGQQLKIDATAYRHHLPARGDIVLFRGVAARQPGYHFVKRIIGIPGDIVSVSNGTTFVNGWQIREPYVHHRAGYVFRSRRVPPHSYFVLGDNRHNSSDSSNWPSPWLQFKDITGRVKLSK
ncbi:MAG: hypothetical protein NVSMB52_13320 [Chloroflexota bacterium]